MILSRKNMAARDLGTKNPANLGSPPTGRLNPRSSFRLEQGYSLYGIAGCARP